MDKNGKAVVGRSMEFAMQLFSEIMIQGRGIKKESRLSSGQQGISWTSKYAFMGMTVLGQDIIIDGINEEGLSIGGLWFPGTVYPKINASKKGIAVQDVGNWILSSFSSISEVKEALKQVQIWPDKLAQLGEVPPLHFSVHDRLGKSLVIECINGTMEVSENPIGVLTNAPKFEWHVTNLRNYINLSSLNKKPVSFDGTVLDPTGEGTGLLGLPGDWTPPSRFVRIAVLKNFVQKAETPLKNVNLAFHLLNNVDIPYGAVKGKKRADFDYTQWAIVKDLVNKRLYYRTYSDLNIQMVDLSNYIDQPDFQSKKIPLPSSI